MKARYYAEKADPSIITRIAEDDGELTAYSFSTAFQLDQYASEYKLMNREISQEELEKIKKHTTELPESWDPIDYLRLEADSRQKSEKARDQEKSIKAKAGILYGLTASLISVEIISKIVEVIKVISG